MKDINARIAFYACLIVIMSASVASVGIAKLVANNGAKAAASNDVEAGELKFTKTVDSLAAGSRCQFKAAGGGDVSWSVSDKRCAAVSQSGVLFGKRAGSTVVLAKSGESVVSHEVAIVGKKKIAIDAGHQSRADTSTEPMGPGSSVRKAKVAGGAVGAATKTPEYKLTLKVAKKLRAKLLARGYDVYMIRTKNNVNISNKKRAVMANKSGADVYIRIHADGSSSSSVSGASALYPSKSNPFVASLSRKSLRLSKMVLSRYCAKTGIKNRGCVKRDDLTGTNWSKVPVTLIEMGFLSNGAEDRKMQNDNFQKRMAGGLADGIDAYFGYN